MSTAVDVCICTFQRPALVQCALESLARLTVPDHVSVRVVVVDNDVAGGGRSVVEEFAGQAPFDVVYAIEPRKNIAHARNRAASLARADLIAFIDDDEEVDPGWLEASLKCMNTSGADAVFGPVLPLYPPETPKWIVAADLVDRPRQRTGTTVGSGATGNVLVRRSLLEAFDGPFDAAFGLTGGEDSALFRRASARGFRLVWCDEAQVTEAVTRDRLSIGFLIRRAYRSGQSWARIFLADADALTTFGWFVQRIAYVVIAMVLVLPAALFGPRIFLRMIRKLFLNIGQLSAITGRYFHEYK